MADSEDNQLKQLLQKLDEISNRQGQYQAMFLNNTENTTVLNDSVADVVGQQGQHLSMISQMIHEAKIAIYSLANRVYKNERDIEEQAQ